MIYEAFFITPDVLWHTLRGRGGLYIVRSFAQRYRPNGEIGRRMGLKIPRSKGRAGSIPASGTKQIKGLHEILHAGPLFFAPRF